MSERIDALSASFAHISTDLTSLARGMNASHEALAEATTIRDKQLAEFDDEQNIHPVAANFKDSDEEFYLGLGASFFGNCLEARSNLLLPPLHPAKPWLGPFPTCSGLSGPHALAESCFQALKRVVAGPTALKLSRSLAAECRDHASFLAGSLSNEQLLGDQLLSLACSRGLFTGDPCYSLVT